MRGLSRVSPLLWNWRNDCHVRWIHLVPGSYNIPFPWPSFPQRQVVMEIEVTTQSGLLYHSRPLEIVRILFIIAAPTMQCKIRIGSVDCACERTVSTEINARASWQSVEDKTLGTAWICHALPADTD